MNTKHTEGERIAKVIARAGVASRRDAEKLVEEGAVTVNGKPVTSPATNVGPKDRVAVNGRVLDPPEPTRLWLYHKPTGLVTTAKDEEGRATIFDKLPADMPRVMSIGRLDINSEGLLLLTNDGDLKRRLELPSTGWLRKYRVRINGRPTDETFAPLREGITTDGETFQPMSVSLDRQQGANAWLTIGLREGKNREIRRAMEAIGLQVNRLIRVSYGPFQIGTLAEGEVEEIRRRVLRDQVGVIFDNRDEDESARPKVARSRRPAAQTEGEFEVPGGDGFVPAPKPRGRNTDPTDTSRRFKPPKPGAAKPSTEDKPRKPRGVVRRGEEELTSAPRKFTAKSGPRGTGERSYGDKPRTYGDKPARPAGERSYGDKPRTYGDKPARPAGERSYGDKPRTYGDKPARPAGERSYGDKPRTYGDKPARPAGERSYGDKPRTYGDKPARPAGERSYGEKPRTYGDKPKRAYGDKPAGERSYGDKPRTYGDKPARPAGERSYGDKPRTYGDKPKRAYGEAAPLRRQARGQVLWQTGWQTCRQTLWQAILGALGSLRHWRQTIRQTVRSAQAALTQSRCHRPSPWHRSPCAHNDLRTERYHLPQGSCPSEPRSASTASFPDSPIGASHPGEYKPRCFR